MANDVFANGREIACKKAERKIYLRIPRCLFYPAGVPGNPSRCACTLSEHGYGQRYDKGQQEGEDSDNEIMLKNKSHFKKSMGDEAGCAAKKGWSLVRIGARYILLPGQWT